MRRERLRHRATLAWLGVTIGVFVLYTVVPLVWFNDGHARVAGMPAMLFWYTLLPFIVPGILYALYAYDQRLMERIVADEEQDVA